MPTPTATPDSISRKSNIELLRIISIIMIIAHHIAVHSDFSFSTDVITLNRLWVQFIQLDGKIGVNVFVLISGYFLSCSKSVKISKAVKLWLQVFTYAIVIFLVFTLTGIEPFSAGRLFKSVFPITTAEWWFASSYFVLYLIFPYINKLIRSFSKKEYLGFLALLTFCWCIIPTFLNKPLESNSLLWFVFLYSLAGYIQLHLNLSALKTRTFFMSALVFTLLTFASAVAFDMLGTRIPLFANYATYFYDMQKLPILLISVSLFIGFLKIDIGSRPFINLVSSATFGVYLIHDHDFIRNLLWNTIFKNSDYADKGFFIPYTIAEIIMVFTICTIIELFRIYVIERIYLKGINAIDNKAKNCGKKLLSSKAICKLKKYF